jgi:cyclophilin family peptidyl-prolyl cis-trans isomerase
MQLLDDPDPRVVGAVLGALVDVRAPEIEQILTARLSTDDVAVRSAAADGLGEIGAVSALPALTAAYREWKDEPSWVERAAVIGALASIDGAVARPVLQDALKDRDWAIRRVAADLLVSLGASNAEATIRPAPAGRAISDRVWQWLQAPPFSPHAIIETDEGAVEIELAVLDAPLTVAGFMDLAERGFFDGTPWHRFEPGGMLEGGDPRGDGLGGPGYTIRDEGSLRPVVRGAVGVVSDRDDAGGSRFFIAHSPQPNADGRRTVFGHVVDGMDVIERLEPMDLIRRVTVWGGPPGQQGGVAGQ